MAWTIGAKPATTFTGVDKYDPMFLLLQDGNFCLLQDGDYINIGEVQQNIFTLSAKPSTSFTKVAKT